MGKGEPKNLQQLYVNMLTEAAARTNFIKEVLNKKIEIPTRPAFEICYLQLRMLCELIAIGCLAAHGDIPATRSGKMRSAWAADRILGALEKLHPKFFPVPMKVRKINSKTVLLPRGEISITKADVLTLYRRCGDILHRGSIEGMDWQKTHESEFDQIGEWALKIGELIKSHTISLHNSENTLIWAHVDHSLTGYMELLRDGGR
ncbi:MAG: hypothetical protein WBG10_03050 [Pseudolabrys sp.]